MDLTLDIFFSKQKQEFVEEFKFLYEYNNLENIFYCICEGKEDKICYLPRIRTLLKGATIKIYDVGGKENVLKIYEKCNAESGYNFNKILFFVDKDYDEPLNNSRVYELPVYSIENLYCNEDVLVDFIVGTINIKDARIIEKIRSVYLERENEFLELILPLNKFLYMTKKIYLYRLDYLKDNKIYRMPFHDYLEVELPSIKDEKVMESIRVNLIKIVELESYKEILDNYIFINHEHSNTIFEPLLEKNDIRLIFKGKYQLYFFISFIKSLIADCNLGERKAQQRILADKNYGCTIPLDDKVIFGLLSNYVQLPDCFNTYVLRYKGNLEKVS